MQLAGRELHFESILKNIILNAKDALMDKNRQSTGDRIITVRSVRDNGSFILSIRDNGTGISPEHRARIFEAFFSTRPETGIGLGLGMVRKYASLYDGTIDVVSEPGQGSTFTVTLPTQT